MELKLDERVQNPTCSDFSRKYKNTFSTLRESTGYEEVMVHEFG